MSNNYLPTKTNLIRLNSSLKITKQGHTLLERKRQILQRELEKYKGKEKALREELAKMIAEGLSKVQEANIDIGIDNFINIANGVKVDNYIDIKNITIMGIEIPSAVHKKEVIRRNYGFLDTTAIVDESMIIFNKIQEKIIELAILENTTLRLEKGIMKVSKRAKALENIIIPETEKNIKNISEVLDEREREEFTRLKVLKKKIN